MIRRIGGIELIAGASKRLHHGRGEGIIGLSWIKLGVGIVCYLSVGRFGVYGGYTSA